jgi:hypothetical protein
VARPRRLRQQSHLPPQQWQGQGRAARLAQGQARAVRGRRGQGELRRKQLMAELAGLDSD